MAYDFVKISSTELMEDTTDTTNVLVEENGDVKRIPKTKIGAQADWNETDDTNPAYILNKPTNLGGYLYYEYYSYYLYKCADRNFEKSADPVTQAEFENDYYSSPIMLKFDEVDATSPIIAYNDYHSSVVHMVYDGETTLPYEYNVQWL